MSAEWPGSDNVRFIIVSAHSESPVGKARPAVVTLPEYILGCSEEDKTKSLFLFSFTPSLTHFLSLTHFFFCLCHHRYLSQLSPPSLYWKCLIVVWSTAQRKWDMLQWRQTMMASYLRISMQRGKKKIRNYKYQKKKKSVGQPQRWPIRTQDHWAVNPGLFYFFLLLLQAK